MIPALRDAIREEARIVGRPFVAAALTVLTVAVLSSVVIVALTVAMAPWTLLPFAAIGAIATFWWRVTR